LKNGVSGRTLGRSAASPDAGARVAEVEAIGTAGAGATQDLSFTVAFSGADLTASLLDAAMRGHWADAFAAAPSQRAAMLAPRGAAGDNPGGGRGPVASASSPAAEILVQFSSGTGTVARMEALDAIGGRAVEVVRGERPGQGDAVLVRVALGQGMTEEHAAHILSQRKDILSVERNWTVSVDAVSNDPAYSGGSLWGMYGDATAPSNAFGSQAAEAWAAGAIGATKIVVGVIDTGIAYTHVDLYQNVWLNQREIPVTPRSALIDVDADGLITFRDLNHASNGGGVADTMAR